MSIAQRLEHLPFTPFHRRLLILGGCGYMFDGLDSAIVAFTLPVLKTEWHLSGPALGVLGSATYLGYGLGSLLAGWWADRSGRRSVMMSALALYAIGSLLSAVSGTFSSFFSARLLAGLGAGAEATIIAPYLSEFVSSRYRGAFTASLTGFYSFGYVAAAILGFMIVPSSPDGWRWALVATALPVLMLLWWRRTLPESPRWLDQQGRTPEACRIVGTIEQSAGLAAGLSITPDTAQKTHRPLSDLFTPGLRRSTFMSWAMWLSITFCFYAFFTWIPTLMIERGMTVTRSFAYAISIYAAQLPGYLASAFCTERLGRRATVATFMIGGGISAIGMAASQTPTQVLLFGIMLSMFMNGTYGGIYAYTPELFPTSLRGRGMGLASAIARLGAISSPVLIGWIYPKAGFPGVFGLTTCVLLIGASITLLFGPRTEKRPLDQEQAFH
ncbi:MFS transporter [Gluconobacter frateurii]|uniref:MFS transporter n=1 Tax=Gluconobacter frateurii TaxID=38308 RepID=UPI001F051D05|nr:MFS transporter [Gluconobacter frateurii]UMM09635.1 MFS transporter [Gluconobacter frateurii]